MPERHELEAVFVEHLPLIERLIGSLCRRHGTRGADAEDAASWIKTRVVESEYSILKKFRGESSLATYLTVAIAMLFRDYQVQMRGRWRPSAAALRQGPLAVRLEALVRRDGLHLQEAAELLRTSGEATASEGELALLLASLPERAPLRPIDIAADPDVESAAEAHSDDLVLATELDAERRDAHSRLLRAIGALPAEDQVMIRLRFWEGRCVPDIARALAKPQKQLYRRLARALTRLRRALEATGVSRDTALSLLNDDSR